MEKKVILKILQYKSEYFYFYPHMSLQTHIFCITHYFYIHTPSLSVSPFQTNPTISQGTASALLVYSSPGQFLSLPGHCSTPLAPLKLSLLHVYIWWFTSCKSSRIIPGTLILTLQILSAPRFPFYSISNSSKHNKFSGLNIICVQLIYWLIFLNRGIKSSMWYSY